MSAPKSPSLVAALAAFDAAVVDCDHKDEAVTNALEALWLEMQHTQHCPPEYRVWLAQHVRRIRNAYGGDSGVMATVDKLVNAAAMAINEASPNQAQPEGASDAQPAATL